MRILWADDQLELAKTFSLSILEGNKHKLTFVDDGQKALTLLNDRVFDVVILDLAMPPGAWGGLWVLERLRDLGHRIPVIVLSGEGRQPETIKAIRYGARDFITKEQASTELSERLAAILGELWSEVHREVLTSFPSQLALAYKRYVTSATPQGKMRAFIDIYEQALRLASIVGLAEAGLHNVTISAQVVAQMARPSIGTWHRIVQTLNKQLPPGTCLSKFWRSIEEQTVTEVVKTRNEVAHGYEFGELKAESWLLYHQPSLFAWLARLWQRIPFSVFAVLSSSYDGMTLTHNVVALEGESAVLPKRQVMSKENLVLHHSYLEANADDRLIIPLYPLLLIEHGDELGSWRAHCFDGWQSDRNAPLGGGEQLRYLELWSGKRTDSLGSVVKSLPSSIWRKPPNDR